MTKSMKRIHTVTLKRIVDKDPDTSYLEQDEFEGRLRQFNEGQFCFMGIVADAEVSLSRNEKPDSGYLLQTISSGGLWGIESDSDESYLQEIEQEQLMELRGQLHAVGFSQRAITAAFRDVTRA